MTGATSGRQPRHHWPEWATLATTAGKLRAWASFIRDRDPRGDFHGLPAYEYEAEADHYTARARSGRQAARFCRCCGESPPAVNLAGYVVSPYCWVCWQESLRAAGVNPWESAAFVAASGGGA